MKLVFVRHGESEANLLNEFSNRGFKHPLTEKGRQQARELAQKLAPMGVDRIFSSPLMRAVQTSEILADAFRISFETTDALREYDCGILEGTSDAAGWKIYDDVMRDWVNGKWNSRIEGGDSFFDMRLRFVPFVERLVGEHGEASENIVLVSHGGLFRHMLPLVLVNIDPDFALNHPIRNTAFIVAEPGSKGLTCVEWCGLQV
jgi:broad specificity phosphatase PhoE